MRKFVKYLLAILIISSFGIVKDVSAIMLNKDDIGNSTYVIGKAIYTREELGAYKGRLTTNYIMLAAQTIEGNSIEDMIILYKNAKGEWINGLDSSVAVVIPEVFEIHYKNGQKYPETQKYTVTFNTDGGNEISSKEVNEGEKVEKPEDPTKEGYTFVKWQLNGEDYDFETAVTGNIELKAIWEKVIVKYTVTFNTDGGNEISSKEVNEGEKVEKPEDPTKEGYTFVKWQLNGEDYDFETVVTGNIELKAVWEKVVVKYTIKKVPVDQFSPDVFLKVYADGEEITFKKITYNNVIICTANLPAVNAGDISGITTFLVTLEDGNVVEATVEE